MKRARPAVDAEPCSEKRRRQRSAIMAFFCPRDKAGPRITTLIWEFDNFCQIRSHKKWLRLLHTACEKQGCHVTNCATGDYFSQTHGAKTLINSMTMFLTYYVPRKVSLRSDDEWRQVLAALRTFHDFCVRKLYAKDDAVLMTALHRLRRFRICTIPERLEQLAMQKYWDTVERANGHIDEGDESCDIGTRSTALETEESELRTGENRDAVEETEWEKQQDRYESYLGGEEPLSVEQIMDDGWLICSEDSEEQELSKAFLHLPEDVAKMGMKGMSLSCMRLALRKGIWRPVLHDGTFVGYAYPPDEVFYY